MTESDVIMQKQIYKVVCPRCGEEFNEKSKKCPSCGAPNRKAVCRTCGAQISAKAKKCPACGACHRKRMSTAEQVIVILCIALFFILCVALLSQGGSSDSTVSDASKTPDELRAEYIAECEDLSYSGISRTPDEYKGRKTVISGTVIQVQEGILDSAVYRVQTDYGIWYVAYTRGEGESRILENDWITCYGECNGVATYIAILGNSVTVPSMTMKYYDRG